MELKIVCLCVAIPNWVVLMNFGHKRESVQTPKTTSGYTIMLSGKKGIGVVGTR